MLGFCWVILLLIHAGTATTTTTAWALGKEEEGGQRAAGAIGYDDDDDGDLPKLDTNRVDALGWTDAHHAAYGSAVATTTTMEGILVVPQEKSRAFLERSPESFLCRRNDFGQTALHLAVRQENHDVVSLYAQRQLSCLDRGNRDGDTPLHYAAAWGRRIAAKILLEGGADPTIRSKAGKTPMDDALSYGHKDLWHIMNESLVVGDNGGSQDQQQQQDQEL